MPQDSKAEYRNIYNATGTSVSHAQRNAEVSLIGENQRLKKENFQLWRCLKLLRDNSELECANLISSVIAWCDEKFKNRFLELNSILQHKNRTSSPFRPISPVRQSPEAFRSKSVSPVVPEFGGLVSPPYQIPRPVPEIQKDIYNNLAAPTVLTAATRTERIISPPSSKHVPIPSVTHGQPAPPYRSRTPSPTQGSVYGEFAANIVQSPSPTQGIVYGEFATNTVRSISPTQGSVYGDYTSHVVQSPSPTQGSVYGDFPTNLVSQTPPGGQVTFDGISSYVGITERSSPLKSGSRSPSPSNAAYSDRRVQVTSMTQDIVKQAQPVRTNYQRTPTPETQIFVQGSYSAASPPGILTESVNYETQQSQRRTSPPPHIIRRSPGKISPVQQIQVSSIDVKPHLGQSVGIRSPSPPQPLLPPHYQTGKPVSPALSPPQEQLVGIRSDLPQAVSRSVSPVVSRSVSPPVRASVGIRSPIPPNLPSPPVSPPVAKSVDINYSPRALNSSSPTRIISKDMTRMSPKGFSPASAVQYPIEEHFLKQSNQQRDFQPEVSRTNTLAAQSVKIQIQKSPVLAEDEPSGYTSAHSSGFQEETYSRYPSTLDSNALRTSSLSPVIKSTIQQQPKPPLVNRQYLGVNNQTGGTRRPLARKELSFGPSELESEVKSSSTFIPSIDGEDRVPTPYPYNQQMNPASRPMENEPSPVAVGDPIAHSTPMKDSDKRPRVSPIQEISENEPLFKRSQAYKHDSVQTSFTPQSETSGIPSMNLSSFRPSHRLLGEIAFQLERRILDYIFSRRVKKERLHRRFYGYTVSNIPSMLARESTGKDGKIDLKKRMTYQYRYDYIIKSLVTFGYILEKHSQFSLKMINRYGLLSQPPDRETVEAFGLQNPNSLRMFVTKLSSSEKERVNMMILLECLLFLAHSDGLPIFLW